MTLHYVRGEWSEGDDPVGAFEEDNPQADFVVAATAVGFREWARLGEYPYSPFIVVVYTRHGASPFALFDLEGNEESFRVYAGDLADAMELLRQWAPIAQSAAVVDLARKLDKFDAEAGDFDGLVGLVRSITKSE